MPFFAVFVIPISVFSVFSALSVFPPSIFVIPISVFSTLSIFFPSIFSIIPIDGFIRRCSCPEKACS